MTRFPSFLSLLLTGLLAACGGELTDEQATSSTAEPASSVVSTNGRLKVCGNKICNSANTPVQLKGMSMFWSNTGWGAERFYNGTAVGNLTTGWGATVVRAAIGVDGGGGYMDAAQRAANVARAKAVIDGAITAGIYVIVDWHSHELHQAEAQAFFGDLARTYATSNNVIWETFNEPTSQSWSSLKSYHTAVIGTIRSAGSQNLVIVGSPTWSQDVDVAANDPVADANTAYTLHFYAGSHGQGLRDKANAAMAKGKAVFVTEYGTCDASGNGGFNATESNNWASWMDTNKISSANWSLNDKAETASALLGGASATGPWTDANLTESGKWAKGYISKSGGGGTSYALDVTRSGTGGGTITSSTGGINCGATCSATYSSGTTVTLTAAAASGSTFAAWGGACSGTAATCTLSMTAARSVSATFNTTGGGTTYTATVTKSGTGSGTVISSTGGINCGATCSASYASGTTVTLTAAAASGSTFGGWSGACTGTGTCALSMTAARNATATFTTSGGGTTPCANAITMTGGQSGNFNTTGAVCLRTASRVNGWGCSNFSGRTVSVNGGTASSTCGAGPFPLAQVGGYTYFAVSAGGVSYASLYFW
jgi:endoglucanase